MLALGSIILVFWEKQNKQLAAYPWLCCCCLETLLSCTCPLHRISASIERVVVRPHKCDQWIKWRCCWIFWMEFKNFISNRYPFVCPGRFSSKDTWERCHHIQHCLTLEFLDLFACWVTSKHLGIGAGERSCSNVKTLKMESGPI